MFCPLAGKSGFSRLPEVKFINQIKSHNWSGYARLETEIPSLSCSLAMHGESSAVAF